ncbi:DUF975 family protein [Fictibacillus sp. KIGAM418]|uniref:DUF975 family protein n=1 Tax=Fictibacillus marinisediminis TaxID=2878389 RepID=A0A9X2BIK1_9BACL|nr:DUF975 family protein [Fictibacillus marinisediminis]MCK6258733.1 DUF975 family protein [Fictibacillus marinisediminis]
MSIGEIKKEARVALENKWGFGVLLTILLGFFTFFLPNLIDFFVLGGKDEFNGAERSLSAYIFSWIINGIVYPITIGFSWVFLSLIRREPQEVKNMFQPFLDIGTFLKIIGTTILVWIFTVLWTLLLIVPGIIKGLAYSQTFYVLKDNPGISITGAITESRRLMDGYKWKYFLLQLSFIGWVILAVVTLFIGFLWLTPYMSASSAEFYNEIRQAKNKDSLEA